MSQEGELFYPIDTMASTAKDLKNFLEDQWNQHQQLFMNNSDSYHNLLCTVAKQQPDAGSFAANLSQVLQDHHKKIGDCYTALHTLAEQIDQAQKSVQQTDQNVSKTFNGF